MRTIFTQLREILESSKKPLFLYDDDPDGLASFLLCYRFIKEGRGIVVKSIPVIDIKFVRMVQEQNPDKVFILDVPKMDDEFIAQIKIPIIWVDHHDPQEEGKKVTYLNPKVQHLGNIPTSNICYNAVQQDIWIAAVGTIGDWHLPDFIHDFGKEYPGLLPETFDKPQDILFNSKLGILVKVFSFILKGKSQDSKKYVEMLTKIKSPLDILEQRTEEGKLLYDRYATINASYERILQSALEQDKKEEVFVHTYTAEKMSFTKDLSNELLYKLKKVIIIGRKKAGQVRCSLRSPENINIKQVLEHALVGIEGYGGGHINACGASVKEEDFDRFVENVKQGLAELQ